MADRLTMQYPRAQYPQPPFPRQPQLALGIAVPHLPPSAAVITTASIQAYEPSPI